MIGLIAVTGSGRAAAARLAAAWPGQARSYDGPPRQALQRAWAQCDGLVCFLAVGATVRLIAPLLDSKWTDPAVVCIDESARHAVAVVGGHAAGANALAARVAGVFGADVVITTATDAMSLPGLTLLGWPTEGAIGTVSRALLDGERVRLESERTWPLPPLPEHVGDAGEYRILVTDRLAAPGPRDAILRPPSLVIGVDSRSGVAADEVLRLADGALAEAGLSAACVAALATTEAKLAEPGVQEAARDRGWPLVGYPVSRLDAVAPLRHGRPAAVTTISVAEAAALAGASELVLPEHGSAGASVAVARIWPRGRLAMVGTGPGARDLLSPRAVRELRRASIVAGLGQSLEQVSDLLRVGTRLITDEPGEDAGDAGDAACVRKAVREARRGHAVAVTFPAGPGLHAMASLLLDLAGDDVDIVEVPGITADLACGAAIGAPQGDYHAVISPARDTPWEVIARRVQAVAEADFVITFGPSPGRPHDRQFEDVLTILRQHRSPDTPVAVVQDAQYPEQLSWLTILGAIDPRAMEAQSIVVIGSSRTRVIAGRMVTRSGD
ncbi:MAG TPA: cobalamin biosynthesis protein [Streptosporangiaceae bacterium]|nr:cobalamin biosynthesis protein [Streptosporangiaceae bacterium]